MLLSKLLSKVVKEGASGSADKAKGGGYEHEEVECKASTISDLYSSTQGNKALESGFRRKLNLSPAEEARLITNISKKMLLKQMELDERLYDQDMCFVDIWDLTGQNYFAALKLMAAVRSLYVVLFDSSLTFQEKYSSLFCVDSETCIKAYGGSTNFQNLEQWPNVIHQVTARKGTTFVVGSRIDKITPSKQSCQKETLKNFWDITRGKPHDNNSQDVCFVDSTLSSKKEEDTAVMKLRQCLIDQMLKQPEFNERVPLRWLRFAIIIRSLAKKGHQWLALDSARTSAKQACQTIDDNEVIALPQYHPDLGFIFHYSENPMLHSKSIIGVAWLLEIVAALFVPLPKQMQGQSFCDQFDLLRDRGVLMESLARHIWQTSGDHVGMYTKTVEQCFFFFHLMECSVLFCDGETTPVDKEPPSKKFIVPSLVSKQATVKTNHAAPTASCPLPIYLYSGAKVIFPQTLFWSLIVRCLQEWVLGPHKMAALRLYRNEAHILYQQHVWVVLHYFLHGIQVSIEPVLYLQRQTPICDVCLRVQDFLNTTLLQLRNDRFKQLHWLYTAKCRCDLYVKEQCPHHDQYSCPNMDCYHVVEFKEAVPCCNEDQLAQNMREAKRFWRCTGQAFKTWRVAENPKIHPTGSQAASIGCNLAGIGEINLDSGRNDATTTALPTWPFFTSDFSDLIDYLHSEQSLKRESYKTAKSFSMRPFAGSSFPRPVKEAREREIPYLPCQTVCGVIGENGAVLQLGNVKAKYPSGALPLHSRVAMMSMEIEPGFRLDGEVAFSPQVSIGPHCGCHLDKPVTLCLPLKVDKEIHVTALVSKTAAGLAADWEMVPASDILVCDDYVEVTATANCIYQVQCSCKYIIKPGMEYTYFSISRKVLPSNHTLLLLHCSASQEACTRTYGDYRLCHPADETIRIRAVHGDALYISLKSVGRRAIKQFNTPFDINRELDCTLDEQFSISVGPTASDRSAEKSSEDEQEYISKLYWRIALADLTSTPGFASDDVDGLCELMVQPRKLFMLEMPETPSADNLICRKCHELRDVSGIVSYMSFSVKQDATGLQAASDLPSLSSRYRKIDHFQETASGRKLMLQIFDRLSKDFGSMSMCDSLAIHLNLTTIEQDFVQDFKRQNPNEESDYCYIACQIMRKWLREDDSAKTWPVSKCLNFLCKVLDEDMGRKDLEKKCFSLWQFYQPYVSSSKVGRVGRIADELLAKASNRSEGIDDVTLTSKSSLFTSSARVVTGVVDDENAELNTGDLSVAYQPVSFPGNMTGINDASTSSENVVTGIVGDEFAELNTDMIVNERDIPYSSAVLATGIIGDEGAELSTGDVSVVYPPGSLPSNTPIDMMVAFLPSGFKLAGTVSLSPQVTVGPYGENVLSRPIKLYLPLTVAEGSTVLVRRSETDCIEPFAWQDVPSSEYVLCDGKVVITAMGSTIYQAISCPEEAPKIQITGNCLHFCLFQRSIMGGKFLQLRCANEESVCTRPEGKVPTGKPFHQLGTVLIRFPAGADLKMDMCNRYEDHDKICQLTSPYAIIKKNTLLEETIFLRVAVPGSENTFNSGQPVTSIASSTASEVIELWQWEVSPASEGDRHGCGRLTIQAGKLKDKGVNQGNTTDSTEASHENKVAFQAKESTWKGMAFDLSWTDTEPDNASVQQSLSDQKQPGQVPDTMSSEQRSAHGFEPASRHPSQMISSDAMTKVAESIPSLKACRALAAKLQFSPTDLSHINSFDGMTAHCILDKWYAREAENATGRALFDALCGIDLRNIAIKYEGILLGKDPRKSAQRISTFLLIKISKAISDPWECVQLAAALDIGEENVQKVEEWKSSEPAMVFRFILRKWQELKGTSATKGALLEALKNVRTSGLAELFREELVK